MLLVDNPQADIKSFTLTLNHTAGTKRGQGRGSFVSSVTSLVDRFYVDALQYLKVWSAPPPRPKQAPGADAQEVAPPGVAESEPEPISISVANLPSIDQSPVGGSGVDDPKDGFVGTTQ